MNNREDRADTGEEFDKVKASLTSVAPFIASLLRNARVISSKDVATTRSTSEGELIINPDFFNQLDYGGKAWILGHEALHIAFSHPKMVQGVENKELYNVASDAVTNRLLNELIKTPDRLKEFTVSMKEIHEKLKTQSVEHDELERMSAGEIYNKLVQINQETGGEEGQESIRSRGDDESDENGEIAASEGFESESEQRSNLGIDVERDLAEGEGSQGKGWENGELLQDGNPDIYSAEDIEEKWKEELFKAYLVQKTTGKVPAGLKRTIDDLFKSKVKWNELLKEVIHNGLGRTVVSTWTRPSRKMPGLMPGIKRFTYPTVYCLVDTSASIGEEELSQFVTEVYTIAKNTQVVVIPWDVNTYAEVKASNARQMVSKLQDMLKGGGGTVIAPALQKVLDLMKPTDIVVVLTDGDIFDVDKEETDFLFSSVAHKATTAVICSTHTLPQVTGWETIKIEQN
ncbi:MAG: VWA-like domain-containing protein [Archaeoglobaceae archaeon]